jgi:hypothetical protein
MPAQYPDTSPWARTNLSPSLLGYFNIRPVAAQDDDILYVIEPQFNYRPDLLANYLYGTPKLWWVFAQRNMDEIRDPIFDFRSGIEIFLPKKSGLFKLLGL